MGRDKKPKLNTRLIAKARTVLEFAEQRVKEGANSMELSNALYAPDGKASMAFPTEAERNAFCKTKEYKRILKLFDGLPRPPITEVIEFRITADGQVIDHVIKKVQ